MTIAHETDRNPLSAHFSFPSLLRFALPSICMMLCMGLYTIVDTLFVARYVNTLALSAINICTPVLYLIVGITGMLATGASAIIGRKMGQKDVLGARQTFSFIVLFTMLLALAFSAFGLANLEGILRLLGASDLLIPYCRDYLGIQLGFACANMLSCLFQNLFVVAGKPSLGLGLSLLSGLANVVLDYLLIARMGWGIAGASIGTGCSYLLPAVGGLLFFSRRRQILRFAKPKWRLRELAESCGNGASEMVSQASAAVTTFFFNRIMMGLAGEDGVAAVTIMLYSQFLFNALFIGFSMGTAPLFSYNFGSGNRKEIKNLFRLCTVFLALASLFLFALTLMGGPFLSSLFASRDSAVYAIAAPGFRIFAFSFLFCGFNIFASAMFTALSNGKVSALLSFLRTLGFMLACLAILPKLFGTLGVWLAVPLAELLSFALSIFMVWRLRKTYGYA